KALQLVAHGAPGTFELRDVPDPRPGPGEAVVQVHACGLNHLDLWLEEAGLPIPIKLPRTPGGEIAGTIAALGAPGSAGVPPASGCSPSAARAAWARRRFKSPNNLARTSSAPVLRRRNARSLAISGRNLSSIQTIQIGRRKFARSPTSTAWMSSSSTSAAMCS